MNFFLEYCKHPFTIGAVAPSSRHLAVKMLEPVDFNTCKCIVEYGPGTGVFTREVIRRKKDETVFLIIEQNQEFYKNLLAEFGDCKNVILCHGDAAKIKMYLKKYKIEHVDAIISGLPFASLPKDVSTKIFLETQDVIRNCGKFITFQYTMLKKGMFLQYFDIRKTTFELRNFPPAFVLTMTC